MLAFLLMTLEEEEQNRILALWQRYGTALVRYARRELGTASSCRDAEYMVSEAFERLMIRYERYGGRTDEQIKGLLLRIVANLCRDEHRRRKRIEITSLYEEAQDVMRPQNGTEMADPTPEELVVSEDNLRRMKEVFRSLPPIYRDVIEMKLLEELSDREIARELGIAEGTVRQRLSRARKAVIQKWEAEDDD